jgi:N-acetylglucosamine-6-sulfatase
MVARNLSDGVGGHLATFVAPRLRSVRGSGMDVRGMFRRVIAPSTFVVGVAIAVGASVAPVAPSTADAEGLPNVVVILTDDHRWDQIDRMPILQSELVGKGTDFRNAFLTNALCCPSRATYLTGTYSHTNGVYTNGGKHGGFARFRDSSTVATWLDAAGYRTGYVGKYFNLYKNAGYIPPGWDTWHAFVGTPGYFNYTLTHDGVAQSYGSAASDYSTDVLARSADAFIRSADPGAPLFLYFAPYAPHGPLTPAPRYSTALSDFVGIRPPNLNEPDVSDKPAWVRSLSARGGNGDATRKAQYRMLLAVDDAIGTILAALEDGGRLSETLFVFAADNGWSGRSHRWTGKEAPYEEVIRTPLVIRYDPVTGGVSQVDDHLALNLDIAQTIAEVAGVPAPGAEGRSLLPLMSGDDVAWRSEFLIEHLRTATRDAIPTYCAVRSTRYKYVKYETGEEELYDLSVDPYELDSKHADPAMAGVKAELLSRLRELCSPPPPNFVP